MTHFEFTPEQNERINELRNIIGQISYLLYGLGFLLLLVGHKLPLMPGWAVMGAAVFFLVLGVVYHRPLDNLERAVATSADDISQMMIAMDDLRSAFSSAQAILVFLIALALLGLSIELF